MTPIQALAGFVVLAAVAIIIMAIVFLGAIKERDDELSDASLKTTNLRLALHRAEADVEGLADQNYRQSKEIGSLNTALTAATSTIDELQAQTAPFDPLHPGSPARLLAQLVAAECDATATYDECRAVAQVVLNRAMATKTLLATVILSKGQFSPVDNGDWLNAQPTVLEMAAAYNCTNALDKAYPSITSDTLYFCAAREGDEFFRTKLQWVCQLGGTAFYRERK